MTASRRRLLEPEAAVLDLLDDNAAAVTSVVTAEGTRVPRFTNGSLQSKVLELARGRDAAFEELRSILSKL